jgi:hypothetical protein
VFVVEDYGLYRLGLLALTMIYLLYYRDIMSINYELWVIGIIYVRYYIKDYRISMVFILKVIVDKGYIYYRSYGLVIMYVLRINDMMI